MKRGTAAVASVAVSTTLPQW